MQLRFEDSFKDKGLLQKAKALYNSAFPKEEKIPWFLLRRAYRRGRAEFLSVLEGEKFIGIAYNVFYGGKVCLFYFAVEDGIRGGGYGSEILSMLKNRYPDTVIYLEAEKPDPNAQNNEMRIRREGFYARNGFFPCGYDITEYGVTYDVLACGGEVSFEEYKELMRYFFGKLIYWIRYGRKAKKC